MHEGKLLDKGSFFTKVKKEKLKKQNKNLVKKVRKKKVSD